MAAIHYGHCQCCGRRQKLPGGILSNHGYTVRAGFFEGVCMGAGHLPFEISKDLVETFIARAEERKAAIVAEIAGLRAPATGPKAWAHEYRPATWARGNRRSGYVWREVEIVETLHTYPKGDGTTYTFSRFHYVGLDKRENRIETYGGEKTIADVATKMNGARADAMGKTVAEIDQFIAWQKGRIANWKPAELEPIAK
jgi:hypothetical protein